MDYVPWNAKSGRPRPLVPYVAAGVPECRGLADMKTWLFEHLSSALLPSSDLALVTSCQAGLYFGLLSVFLDDEFVIGNFLANSIDGDTVVSAKELPTLLSLKRNPSKSQIGKGEGHHEPAPYNDDVVQVLSRAARVFEDIIVPRVVAMEKQLNFSDVWSAPLYNVYLSIEILLETLSGYLGEVQPETVDYVCYQPSIVSTTQALGTSLTKVGRCKSTLGRLGLRASFAYQLLSLPFAGKQGMHHQCSMSICKMFNIDQSTYKTKHVRGCVESKCTWVKIDQKTLIELIDQDQIPLISSSVDAHNQVRLEVIPASQAGRQGYVSVSHVWAGGLGNFTSNSLPMCQLLELHDLIDNSAVCIEARAMANFSFLHDEFYGDLYNTLNHNHRKVYWLDTLCIPVNAVQQRKKAIGTMAQIYGGSSNVIVLDPELQITKSADLATYTDLDLAVASSPWMSRSWTLQEGALATDLRFVFQDQTMKIPLLEGPNLTSQSLVQKLWQEDIEYEETDHRISSLNGYAVKYFKQMYTSRRERGTVLPEIMKHSNQQSLSTSSSTRFTVAWNDLRCRNTTQIDDLAAILGSLLNFSADEILGLPQNLRMKAIIKSQRFLPSGILFAPTDEDSSEWVPQFPSSINPGAKLSNAEHQSDLEVTEQGFIMRQHRGAIVEVPSHINTVGNLHLVDSASGLDVSITFPTNKNHKLLPCVLPKLFLFDQRDSTTDALTGLCFSIVRKSKDGVHIRFHTLFEYKNVRAKSMYNALPGTSYTKTFTVNSVIHSRDISIDNPLVIDMNMKSWPVLSWSRFDAFPFVKMGLGKHEFIDLMPPLTSIPGVIVLAYNLFLIYYVYHYTDAGVIALLIGLALVSLILCMINMCAVCFEYQYLRQCERQWMQQKWAASLSDSKTSRRILNDTSMPYVINLTLIYLGALVLSIVATATSRRIIIDIEVIDYWPRSGDLHISKGYHGLLLVGVAMCGACLTRLAFILVYYLDSRRIMSGFARGNKNHPTATSKQSEPDDTSSLGTSVIKIGIQAFWMLQLAFFIAGQVLNIAGVGISANLLRRVLTAYGTIRMNDMLRNRFGGGLQRRTMVTMICVGYSFMYTWDIKPVLAVILLLVWLSLKAYESR